ncbi:MULTISPECIES: endonuclease/exonuclease/phosphatase family protein [unclassified Luteimonas]|uniref:endonuclease/exonuclease/phosphatase family protein n=1 Tax=unclassified Luteimonas TaxID=2629088 RepID=UPI0018F0FAC3|nr:MULTISPECIES: endonuclease/exonuclease/phosphatase family protein [unclassified Luteimonas]MBJ6978697.1 endonuclease/exonuclease/phosphatase family protein [Luteimonas sp. MC1895]MBJ6983597.1 endonuclease/exonuclease/phosphatase family protein [Luteimonas sp. MC1750]QQO06441.1 endonuclease/exonuclease/phosphatase family protein [Luteimonas sp. MC1750]
MASAGRRAAWALAACVLLAGCVRVNVHGDPGQAMQPATLRVATYNASLYSDASGGLLRRLEAGDGDARKVAAVLQRVRPDVVLVNEFDFDPSGRAADAFQRDYLEVPQAGGGDALRYRYRYFAPVNTGVPSGLDLDRSGDVGAAGPVDGEDAAAARGRGNDAWGYGLHPGQYGMLLLSMHPIDTAAIRTFQRLRWSAMPGAARPVDPATGGPWHDDAIWSQLRLSSKSHWDVPVRTPLGTVHMLASHPTPPVFDGPEDRNGARNHDEIRLWTEYLGGGRAGWLCDDAGRCGGLDPGARFVILGDLNNDPVDGDGRHEAITGLLSHPRVLRADPPASAGARHAQGADRPDRRGDAGHATGDFGPRVGPLRLDYALPSSGFRLRNAGVFWPAPGTDGAGIIDGTDHRLIWVDLANP